MTAALIPNTRWPERRPDKPSELLAKLSEHRAAVLTVARDLAVQRLTDRDILAAALAQADEALIEAGRVYLRERNPDQREFLRPTVERIRLELGAS